MITRLIELETLKTWSLIVTLFGDLDGRDLTGAEIRAFLGHVGIKPEAIRVALHRLRSDGWITSQKTGREAVYGLSEKARCETKAATEDVYGMRAKYPDGWQFHLVEEGHIANGTAIPLSRDLALVPKCHSGELRESLVLAPVGQEVPAWIQNILVPSQMLENAAELVRAMAGLPESNLTHTDQTCLRLLVLHHWRRLALRPGSWAHISLVPEGVLAKCQTTVTQFLNDTPGLSCAAPTE